MKVERLGLRSSTWAFLGRASINPYRKLKLDNMLERGGRLPGGEGSRHPPGGMNTGLEMRAQHVHWDEGGPCCWIRCIVFYWVLIALTPFHSLVHPNLFQPPKH